MGAGSKEISERRRRVQAEAWGKHHCHPPAMHLWLFSSCVKAIQTSWQVVPLPCHKLKGAVGVDRDFGKETENKIAYGWGEHGSVWVWGKNSLPLFDHIGGQTWRKRLGILTPGGPFARPFPWNKGCLVDFSLLQSLSALEMTVFFVKSQYSENISTR